MTSIPEEAEYSNLCYSGLSQQQTSNLLSVNPNLVTLVQTLSANPNLFPLVQMLSVNPNLVPLLQMLSDNPNLVPLLQMLSDNPNLVPLAQMLSDNPNLVPLVQMLAEQHHVMTVPLMTTLSQQLEQHLQVMSRLENLVQNGVKEQIEIALQKFNARAKWLPGDETHSSEPRHLALKFLDDVCIPVYTGQEIKAGGNNNIRLALYDADGKVVNSGSAASSEVEIMVLVEGINDVGSSCKKRMSPLLSKNRLKLKEGIAVLDGMKFKHKSEWTKGCKIKLVARAVENFLQTTVEQAETGFFSLRDSRSGWKKKHHPPSLEDEVFRLKKIGKNGDFHRRLNRESIRTVKDFLTEFFIDPTRLRNIMGTGMSPKMWEVTVEHAQTCILEKKLNLCFLPGSQQKKLGVVFNVVGQVIGMVSDYQYITIDKLSEAEKACARELVVSAYRHRLEVVRVDNEASLLDGSLFLPTIEYSANPPLLCNSDGNRVLQSHVNATCDHPEPSTTSPDSTAFRSLTTLEELPPINPMAVSFDRPLIITGQVEDNNNIFDNDFSGKAFYEGEYLQVLNSDYTLEASTVESSSADLQAAVSGFLSHTVPNGKAQKRWKILFSVMKWFQIRKYLVRRRLC